MKDAGGGKLTNQELVKKAVAALGSPTVYKAPKVTAPYTGPLNKTQAPYVPGLSDNPAILGTSTEIYSRQNSNGTPNNTFFPNASGTGYYGAPAGDKPVDDIIFNDYMNNATPTNNVTSVEVAAPVRSRSSGRSSGGGSSRPQLRSGQSMADLAGIRYDQGYISDLMRDAVEKQYANLDNEYGRTQDLYYDVVAGNADMLMQSLRRGDREAAMSGLGSGTQVAGELGALLGVSKDNAQGATELAQARGDLVTEREAAKAQVAVDALKYYNDLGLNLMALSNSELNALVTAYASEVATEGGIYNTDVLAAVERERIGSNERIATDQNKTNLSISKNNSYSSGGSGSSSNNAAESSNYEKAAILWGLYEETGNKAYLEEVAKIYGISVKDLVKKIEDTQDPTKPKVNVELTDVIGDMFGKDNSSYSYWGGRPQAGTPAGSKSYYEIVQDFITSQRNNFPMAGALDFNKKK